MSLLVITEVSGVEHQWEIQSDNIPIFNDNNVCSYMQSGINVACVMPIISGGGALPIDGCYIGSPTETLLFRPSSVLSHPFQS